MSFLKKVFKRSKETSEEKSAKQQEVNLSLDDSFVHYFLEKGGKFLYCTKKEEIEFHLQNIIKENNWKECCKWAIEKSQKGDISALIIPREFVD